MATHSMVQQAIRPQAYVCTRCVFRQSLVRGTRRSISTGFLRKTLEAERMWKVQAKEIREGRKKSMLSVLEERGFIKDIAGKREALDDLMIDKRVGAYVGVDPTAPSLHVGNIVPMMALFWMYIHGFKAVTLLGGATAKVGDPSGRTTARTPQTPAARKANMVSMHAQLKQLWMHVEALANRHGYQKEWAWSRDLSNNNTWLNKLPVTDFLRDLGPGMRLGEMLSRDTVKVRMESGEGMSFAELCYPLLQAWDWWHMYHTKNVQIQIGGSDQYGNIVTGIDAINHIRKTHHHPDVKQETEDSLMVPYGFTTPLLTTASGEKFGKSAGNAVWLDQDMMSSFDLYQFFVKSADADVERYLKMFTFLPLEQISETMQEHAKDPSKRIAQHLLASEFVELAHGRVRALKAAEEHRALFSRGTSTINLSQIKAGAQAVEEKPKKLRKSGLPTDISPSLNEHAPNIGPENAPNKFTYLPRSLVVGKPFSQILWFVGLVSSKGEGHRLVNNQGAYVASRPGQIGDMGDELKWTPIKTFDPHLPAQFIIEDELLVMRVGKWNIRIVRILDDEEYLRQGRTCPGWEPVKVLGEEEYREITGKDPNTEAEEGVVAEKGDAKEAEQEREQERLIEVVEALEDPNQVKRLGKSTRRRLNREAKKLAQRESWDAGHFDNLNFGRPSNERLDEDASEESNPRRFNASAKDSQSAQKHGKTNPESKEAKDLREGIFLPFGGM